MFKVLFSPAPFSHHLSPAQQQTTIDAITFSSQIGFQPILFHEFLGRPSYYAKLIASWRVANIFLTLYPQYCRGAFSTANPLRHVDMCLLDFLDHWNQRVRSILVVDDLPIDQALALDKREAIDTRSYEIEARIFQLFDILCVYSEAMKRTISERYNISSDKFVEIELRDYGIAPSPPQLSESNSPPLRWKLVCAGNGAKVYSGEWAKRLPQSDTVSYEFIGVNWEWISEIGRHDLVHKGVMSQQELCNYISRYAHFGIVAYSDKVSKYSNYVIPSKFPAYVSAGLPVLVSSECEHLAFLANKYGIGFALDSFDDMPALLQNLTEFDYRNVRRRCLQLAEKLRSGYFFKRAIVGAMDKLAVT